VEVRGWGTLKKGPWQNEDLTEALKKNKTSKIGIESHSKFRQQLSNVLM
jgi:hypothetical protein